MQGKEKRKLIAKTHNSWESSALLSMNVTSIQIVAGRANGTIVAKEGRRETAIGQRSVHFPPLFLSLRSFHRNILKNVVWMERREKCSQADRVAGKSGNNYPWQAAKREKKVSLFSFWFGTITCGIPLTHSLSIWKGNKNAPPNTCVPI